MQIANRFLNSIKIKSFAMISELNPVFPFLVIPYWYKAVEEKIIPPSGNTLVSSWIFTYRKKKW